MYKRQEQLQQGDTPAELRPFAELIIGNLHDVGYLATPLAVSYTHLRAHETVLDLVCRLLLEKKNKKNNDSRSSLGMDIRTSTNTRSHKHSVNTKYE